MNETLREEARLKRNVRFVGGDLPTFARGTEWVAVPAEDFDALLAALASEPAPASGDFDPVEFVRGLLTERGEVHMTGDRLVDELRLALASEPAPASGEESDSWRDAGIDDALRNGRQLNGFQRQRILDRLASTATPPEPGLDAERLAEAYRIASMTPVSIGPGEDETFDEPHWMATVLAAEYARLARSGEDEG